MRIAQIAPLIESVPPRLYGGTERIASYLTEALVAQGHDVTLFASGQSITTRKTRALLRTGASAQPICARSHSVLHADARQGAEDGVAVRRAALSH